MSTIPQEIATALGEHGMRRRAIEVLSPPEPRKRGRSVYRVELEDGRTVKARLLESADAARRLFDLRARIDDAFTPALGHHGCVLLEAWAEGRPLTGADAGRRAAEAGALLARLHATPLADGAAIDAEAPRARAARDLETLAAAGALAPADAVRLAATLRRLDPGASPAALIHRDFCAENMLIDPDGRLRVIDNEWLAVGPPGFDLARTRTRWPMASDVWRRFLRAYRAAARRDPGPLELWTIAAVLMTARVRLHGDPGRLGPALEALRRL
jgi:aminoglycoside phosphotransferase (APT) family kinase protein